MVKIELTEAEAKHIATVFGRLAGKLQYKAVKAKTDKEMGKLTTAWRLNNKIAKKISKSIGYESWVVGVPLGLN